jgi:SAM-dependent methyltransferase
VVNDYSPTWFATFMDSIEPSQTSGEVQYIIGQLPRHAFPRLLDVCCGTGRHAHQLAAEGYRVLGIDRDPTAIQQARDRRGGAEFELLDVRELATLTRTFDAAIFLWASFGHFEASVNLAVLRAIAHRLRPGGRLLLDVYNRDFFESRQGDRVIKRAGRSVKELKRLELDRLYVRLEYDHGAVDEFQWQVFSPRDAAHLARQCGMTVKIACAEFNSRKPPDDDAARMQVTFEKH